MIVKAKSNDFPQFSLFLFPEVLQIRTKAFLNKTNFPNFWWLREKVSFFPNADSIVARIKENVVFFVCFFYDLDIWQRLENG